ncbi:MAG: thiamine phosphate synthase [Prevotella sp.]|nr:thiamine phosphate synthase [Prevotella sp.]
MTQFIATTAREALAAVEAGARWIHFTDPSQLDAIIPTCQAAEVIVTIPGSSKLEKETRIHGVILSPGDMPAAAAREFLGPNAIIGSRVGSLFEIINLSCIDVDFFVLDAPLSEFEQIVKMARAKGVEQPISALSSNPAFLSAGAAALLSSDINLI